MFTLSSSPLNRDELVGTLANAGAGAIVVFEGWVRNHNQGKEVSSLEYQVYEELALKEGFKIIAEAKEKFNLHEALTVHRHGHLQLGEIAVWIGATASHRDDAFKATRFIIDEIKHRLPVWKKEHYLNEKPEWVFCKHHHHHVHFTENDFYQKQQGLVDQNKLKDAKVLIIGAGGLGCPAMMGLASAGIGKLTILDFDKISISNIHRQHLYSPNLVGEKKVKAAKVRLMEVNPFIEVLTLDERIDVNNAEGLLNGHDLILDCTDNMQTKYLVHDACFKLRIPFISASVFKHEGQIRTFVPGSEHGCSRCHVKLTPEDHLLGNCNDYGVLGVTTNALGSVQASEAIQFLQNGTNATTSHTLFFNLKDLSQLKVKNIKVTGCSTCEGRVVLLSNELEVGPEQIKDLNFEVIDIRELKDHELEPLKHSSKNIVLYCHRGVRSKKLVKNFRSSGHSHFYSLKGGACSL